MFNKLFNSCLESCLALYWLSCTYFSLVSYRNDCSQHVCCACVCICVYSLGNSLPFITDLTERHRVFEILKIVEFCGSGWLDNEEGLDLLCRGEVAGNCVLSQPWRLKEAQICRIPGFLIPLLKELISLKILAAAWNVSSLKTLALLLCSSWYMYRAKWLHVQRLVNTKYH